MLISICHLSGLILEQASNQLEQQGKLDLPVGIPFGKRLPCAASVLGKSLLVPVPPWLALPFTLDHWLWLHSLRAACPEETSDRADFG